MGFAVGDGSRISFWSNEWIPRYVLKYNFPRIFALSSLKEVKIKEFGFFENNIWVWRITLRRNVFAWELSQWNELCSLLQRFHVSSSMEDRLIWKDSSSGWYSSKTFCWKFLKERNSSHVNWDEVWSGLLPPKVETFLWQLLKGRVAVKENLVARNIGNGLDAQCVFCRLEIESVSHLFFVCPMSWRVWSHWCWNWGVQWVSRKDPWQCFEQWLQLLPKNRCDKLWRMSFGAVIWSIWLIRNECIFQNKVLVMDHLLDIIKARLAFWAKALWPNDPICMVEIFTCPISITMPKRKTRDWPRVSWVCPPAGHVKFNVDGASIGKPGSAGIGGVLCNHAGEELARFSKSVGIVDSNIAELLAIREAFLVFIDSPFVSDNVLIIESDSKTAVNWVNSPLSAPWMVLNFINHIECLKKQIIGWEVTHIFREANQVEDQLAKERVSRTADMVFMHWG
ncbi:hypothetical protein PTKIN_Ptkin01aG0017700 [Pterospermum kingtungense]